MFRKNISFLALSLAVLSSCVTTGGSKRNKIEKSKKRPDESKPEKGGRNVADNKLESLSNLSKLSGKTKQENVAILNEILKSLNGNNKPSAKDKNGKGGQKGKPNQKDKGGQKGVIGNHQENIEFAERVIKSGKDLKVLKDDVDSFINSYDNTDAFFMDPSDNSKIKQNAAVKRSYDNAENHIKHMEKYYLDKTKGDFPDTNGKKYIEYLQEQLKKSGLSVDKKPEAGKEDVYIKAVEDAYKAKYKQLLGSAEDDLNKLRGDYKDKIKTVKDKLNEIKQNILTAYKKIDPSYSSNELPLAIDDIVKKYKGDRKKIIELLIENKDKLKGLKTLADISNPKYKVITYSGVTVTPMGDDYVIKMGNREFSAKDFSLDTGRNKPSKDTEDEKDKDGKKGKGGKNNDKNKEKERSSFYKAERQISSIVKPVSKFMPKVEEKLKEYGTDETEQSRRKVKLNDLFEKFKNGQCDDKEREEVKKLLSVSGNDIGIKDWKDNFKDWKQEDKDKLELLKKMLKETTKLNFDIKVTENKKDVVKIGGKLAGLTFADFGMWEEQTLQTYSGNNILVNGSCDSKGKKAGKCKSLLPLSKQYSDFYAFATGADKFKRIFRKGGEGKTKFEGKSIVGVTVTGDNDVKNSRSFDGSATLELDNVSGKGDFKFNYTGWYNFKFKNVDLAGKDAYGGEDNNHDVEVDGAGVKDFKLDLTAKFQGKIKGTLYGLEVDKPTETAGVFNIATDKLNNDGTYKNMTIDGAFGMKIQEPKTDRAGKGKGKDKKKK